MRRNLAIIGNFVLFGAITLVIYVGYTHRDEILDAWYLKDYQPPAKIASLADRATMTTYGRRLFYRSKPEVDAERQALAAHCRIQNAKTIELGCYLSTQKIYLLDIQQPELEMEMVVTAAHEMLHAAYDRLDGRERRRLNERLTSAAAALNNEKLKQRLADYERLEPGERDNEIHSILGSEFGGLPADLEEYYATFFANRQAVVRYSDQFNRTFDGLHDEIKGLDNKIQATKANMNALLRSGRVNAYNSQVAGVNADIALYNKKVDQYNRYSDVLLGQQPAQPAQ